MISRIISIFNVLLFLSTGTANADLQGRLGGEVVYDTDRNLSVLANANLAASETFGVSGINPDGSMNWYTALQWVDAMNTSNYLGFNDWRLANAINPELRPNIVSCRTVVTYCLNGDLVHLFLNELSGSGVQGGISGITDPDILLFWNFPQTNQIVYWTGTDASRGRYRRHRVFIINNSNMFAHRISNTFPGFVLPVRDGDVDPSGNTTTGNTSNNSGSTNGSSGTGGGNTGGTVTNAPALDPNATEFEGKGNITAIHQSSLEIDYNTTVWYSNNTEIKYNSLGDFGLGLKVKVKGMKNPDGQIIALKIKVK